MGAFDIQYRPRTSVKWQVLIDFVAEFTPKLPKVLQIYEVRTVKTQEDIWQVYIDGASNYREAGVGIILISSEGIRVEKSFRLGFPISNNEEEYEALLVGLRMSKQIGAERVQLYCDS